MTSRRGFLAGALSACLRAQETSTFSTEVKVVNVLATVTGRNGEIVRALGKDDFVLLEDGRPQEIRYFSRETDLPLTMGLLVDTSLSQQRVLDAERGATMRFLDQVLRETKDHVFLIQFDMAILIRQPLTSSRRQLDDALAFVDTPTFKELRSAGYGPGTLLYDSIVKSGAGILKDRQGRKALIVLSDGVDNGSEASLADAIAAALRADALIYSILFADKSAYGFFPEAARGRKALARMARETGGSFFEVSKKLPIQHVFELLEEELRSQYNLGFVSDRPVRISEFRKLELTTKQKDLVVQARGRYWAKR